jgi:hypothetical protein
MPELSKLSARFRRCYGSNPLHLLTMLAGFGLLGYLVIIAGPATLWKPEGVWWHSIVLWLGAAFIAHDLVLFPIYALADRLLGSSGTRRPHGEARVPPHNYLRVPALGSGLLALIFFPGIIKQGAPLYFADTGLTQQSFLGRWLFLTAAMFAVSAVVYATRLSIAHRHSGGSLNEFEVSK